MNATVDSALTICNLTIITFPGKKLRFNSMRSNQLSQTAAANPMNPSTELSFGRNTKRLTTASTGSNSAQILPKYVASVAGGPVNNPNASQTTTFG